MKKEKSDVINTIRKTMPSVVSIIISKSLKELEKDMPMDLLPFLPFHGPKIAPEDVDANGMVKIGGGSGFIGQSDGIIVTNKHVVSEPHAEYTVIAESGDKFEAQVLARDPISDVALLKIGADHLPVISLGDSNGVELGQTVLAIGNSLGIFKNTVSSGIISGLSRSITAQVSPKSPVQELRGLIQTDAAINPGNSGGPLVNIFGEVIGINAAIVFGAQNIGFAIPINAAKRDLADLKKYGRIRRPLLGIRYVSLNEDLKSKLKLSVDYGALVMKESAHDHGVVPDSPASKAGVQERDIILECNGEKITAEKTIQDFLEDCAVGDELKLKILREGKELEAKALLVERK